MWEQLLKDIKCSWQIVSRKNKKFIRIRFYGTDEKFLILSQNLAEYKEYHLKDIKSDFDTHINNEAIQSSSNFLLPKYHCNSNPKLSFSFLLKIMP